MSMAERISLALWEANQAHKAILHAWSFAKPWVMAGHRLTLEIRPEKRSDAQNRLLWSLLTDIARQTKWHGQQLSAEDYKHMLTAALKKQRVVPGIDGGFVVLGLSTSKMTKPELSELIELAMAFGAEQGVVFHEDYKKSEEFNRG
jgi:hypothetical protein